MSHTTFQHHDSSVFEVCGHQFHKYVYEENGSFMVYVDANQSPDADSVDDAQFDTLEQALIAYCAIKEQGLREWLDGDREDGNWGRVLVRLPLSRADSQN